MPAGGEGDSPARQANGQLTAALAAVAVFALLAAFSSADPAPSITASNSPYTDEGWNVLNARNLVVLGQWSTDDWDRQLITLPHSILHAVVFWLAGPGIVQARMVEVALTAATAAIIALGVRRVTDRGAAVLAAAAFGTSALVLYYGRLALLEPMVSFGLAAGTVLLATRDRRRPVTRGLLAGIAFAAAIGTKIIAVPSVVGILAVGAFLAWADPVARRTWIAAAVGLAVMAATWAIAVALPNWAALAAVLSTLPEEHGPADLSEAAIRAIAYLRWGDGAPTLAAPVLLGGLVGALVGGIRWRSLTTEARALHLMSVAWFVAGFALLALVSYAPNRYFVPLIPPLAILTGIGAHSIGRLMPRKPAVIGGAAAIALLALPGLGAYAEWATHLPSTVPAAQEPIRTMIPPGATVAGNYAPLFAMRTSGPTIFTAFGANDEDLYATRAVRWLMLAEEEVPEWASAHPVAWQTRRLVFELDFGPHHVGLYVLP